MKSDSQLGRKVVPRDSKSDLPLGKKKLILHTLATLTSLTSRSPDPGFEINVPAVLVTLLASAVFLVTIGGGGMMKAEMSSRGSIS